MARLAKASGEVERESERRLQSIEAGLATLFENVLAGVVGPTIMAVISAREAERAALAARVAARARPTRADVIAHPALLRRLKEKIG